MIWERKASFYIGNDTCLVAFVLNGSPDNGFFVYSDNDTGYLEIALSQSNQATAHTYNEEDTSH